MGRFDEASEATVEDMGGGPSLDLRSIHVLSRLTFNPWYLIHIYIYLVLSTRVCIAVHITYLAYE